MPIYRHPVVGYIDVCWTIGAVSVYDTYIASDPDPNKAEGGTVWRTREEAQAYLAGVGGVVTLDDGRVVPGAVYGVLLPSDFDAVTRRDGSFRALTCPGRLMARTDG